MKRIRIHILICLLMGIMFQGAASGTILTTKHNLSISGPGPVKSTTEVRVCVFCHTPHNASSTVVPLWNRQNPVSVYSTYSSSTLYATVGQPTESSKMCLSCHDGTIALGSVLSETTEIPFAGGLRFIPTGPTRLGTDLSDDHPISFLYDTTLATQNGELADPSALPPEIQLDKNGNLQCTSCHDPHDDLNGKFLVVTDRNSILCTSCHNKTGWTGSSHNNSASTWNGQGTDPWPDTSYTTVSENGCQNCHKPHSAGGHERLLRYVLEEDNCLVCHNGNVATTDIDSELAKSFTHPVDTFQGVHDPTEDYSTGTVTKHVECVDCHNPHEANNSTGSAPAVSGANKGVTGITASGGGTDNALNLYEICFKCHGDTNNNVVTTDPTTRQILQLNTRLEFDPANPSYHPVEQQGVNPDVPSLISPLTTSSVIYCTDCHGNDNSGGPKGPHGSINDHILVANYTTRDFTSESATAYALCYKCHSRSSILGDKSFKKHDKHIRGEKTPCNACHDPHGISHTQATSSNGSPNNTHLINFDITIVKTQNGLRRFEDRGRFRGRCFLNCHGEKHSPKSY